MMFLTIFWADDNLNRIIGECIPYVSLWAQGRRIGQTVHLFSYFSLFFAGEDLFRQTI